MPPFRIDTRKTLRSCRSARVIVSRVRRFVGRWGMALGRVPMVGAIAGVMAGGPGAAVADVTVRVSHESLMAKALHIGDPTALEQALAAGASVETPLEGGDRPLLRAVRSGRADLAAVCLDWCADWRVRGDDRADPLSLAILTRDTTLVGELLDAGADPNGPLPAPAPAPVIAHFGDPWFAEQLRFDSGLTPLMLATVAGDEPMVRLLLARGARADKRTRRYGTDCLTLACRAGHMRVGQWLIGRDPDATGNQRLVICLGEQRATLYRGDELLITSRVSTGRKGFPTPKGAFLVTSKHRDWTSTIYKVPMPYLLRLNGSEIGIHQGVVPGYPASHGCIRLPSGKASDFFRLVRVGDPVEIRN